MMFWSVCMYSFALKTSGELMPFKRGCESPSRKPKLDRMFPLALQGIGHWES